MRRPLISPEAQVVLLTAGGEKNDDALTELLKGELDWGYLARLATQQTAVPVLWRRLASLPEVSISAEARGSLQRMAMVAEFRQSFLEQRLHATLRVLSSAGVPVLLLKGAALGATVYPSFAARPMADLDLLVPREAARSAWVLLQEHGWRQTAGEERDEFYRGHHHLSPLEDVSGVGLDLEIHTDLLSEAHPFLIPLERIWEDARTVHVGGQPAYVPSTSDALLHLCVHFFWSHMARSGAWRAFRDLEMLTTRAAPDWDSFARTARAARATTSAYWTLRLARNLAGVRLPPYVLADLRPRQSEAILRRLEGHFTAGLLPSRVACPSVYLSRSLWSLAVQPRRSGHGASRPWQREAVARTTFSPGPPATRVEVLRAQLRNLKAWRQYLGAVLHPPRSFRASIHG